MNSFSTQKGRPVSRTNFNSYRLSIFPTPVIANDIKTLKSSFEEDPDFDQEKPYEMIVAKFFIREAMETTFLRYLNNLMIRQPSFDLSFNNFGGDPACSIFIRIIEKEKFSHFLLAFKSLGAFLERNDPDCVRYYPQQKIYLWKDLPENLFLERMLDLSHKCYDKKLKVESVYLYKEESWKTGGELIQIFSLIPEEIKQPV